VKYRWRDLAFDVDDALDDHTMVVLARPREGAPPGAEPLFNLCVAHDKAGAGFAAYVDEALREMSTSLPGFRLGSRANATLMGKKAVVVEARTLSPEGIPLVQKQAFVERDQDVVVVVTGSAREDAADARALHQALDRLLTSLTTLTPGTP
jgi:hypothetical protein